MLRTVAATAAAAAAGAAAARRAASHHAVATGALALALGRPSPQAAPCASAALLRLLAPADSAPAPAAAAAAPQWQGLLQPLLQPLRQLWEGLLRAVPKKRRSHSRVRKRMNSKWLRPAGERGHPLAAADRRAERLQHLKRCGVCGHWKHQHHLCGHCLDRLMQLLGEAKQKLPVRQDFGGPVSRGTAVPAPARTRRSPASKPAPPPATATATAAKSPKPSPGPKASIFGTIDAKRAKSKPDA